MNSSEDKSQVQVSATVNLSSIDAMFATIGTKLENLKERVDDRFQTLEQRMEVRFDQQDTVIERIEKRTENVEAQTTKTNGRVTAIENKWDSVKYRIGGFVIAMSLLATGIELAVKAGIRVVFK